MASQAKSRGGCSFSIRVNDIAQALDTSLRQVSRSLRDLRDQGYIDIEWELDERGGSAPSTYTILPLEADRLRRLDTVAKLLSLTRGEAMRAIDRLVRTPYDPESVTLQDLADIAGYTGRPSALIAALRIAGFVGRDGLVGW